MTAYTDASYREQSWLEAEDEPTKQDMQALMASKPTKGWTKTQTGNVASSNSAIRHRQLNVTSNRTTHTTDGESRADANDIIHIKDSDVV